MSPSFVMWARGELGAPSRAAAGTDFEPFRVRLCQLHVPEKVRCSIPWTAGAIGARASFVSGPADFPDLLRHLLGRWQDAAERFHNVAQLLKRADYNAVAVVTSEWLNPGFCFGRGFDVYERLPPVAAP